MSLTSHIRGKPDTPITEWFRRELPSSKEVVSSANRKVRKTLVVAPPPGAHAGWLGTAIDYRIRMALVRAPWDCTVAELGALRCLHPRVCRALAAYYEDCMDRLQPWTGSTLSTTDDADLARLSLLLARCDEGYRAGEYACFAQDPKWASARLKLEDIFDAFQPEASVDVWRMMELFVTSDDGLRERVRQGCTIACNPVFSGSTLVGGADADIVCEGELIELKSTKNPGLDRDMLLQMAGYALLDRDDEFGINTVSVYFTRTGQWVRLSLRRMLGMMGRDAPSG